MSYSGFNINLKSNKKIVSSRKKFKVSLIVSDWNEQITAKLVGGAIETLTLQGVLEKNISITNVPGSFELIFEAKKNQKNQNLIQ